MNTLRTSPARRQIRLPAVKDGKRPPTMMTTRRRSRFSRLRRPGISTLLTLVQHSNLRSGRTRTRRRSGTGIAAFAQSAHAPRSTTERNIDEGTGHEKRNCSPSVGEPTEMALQRAIADTQHRRKAALVALAASMAMTPDRKRAQGPQRTTRAARAGQRSSPPGRRSEDQHQDASGPLIWAEVAGAGLDGAHQLAVRSLGRWSGTGFWATRTFRQALPAHPRGKPGLYRRAATRKDPATGLPSATRAVISSGPSCSELGYHRLMMAVRSRWVEGKNATDDLRAVQAGWRSRSATGSLRPKPHRAKAAGGEHGRRRNWIPEVASRKQATMATTHDGGGAGDAFLSRRSSS